MRDRLPSAAGGEPQIPPGVVPASSSTARSGLRGVSAQSRRLIPAPARLIRAFSKQKVSSQGFLSQPQVHQGIDTPPAQPAASPQTPPGTGSPATRAPPVRASRSPSRVLETPLVTGDSSGHRSHIPGPGRSLQSPGPGFAASSRGAGRGAPGRPRPRAIPVAVSYRHVMYGAQSCLRPAALTCAPPFLIPQALI